MRTSITHPLQIAEVRAAPDFGKIGLTFCPGKKQMNAITGSWNRDLDLDLDAVAAWNAAAVVTLLQPEELHQLGVPDLGRKVRERNMDWYHLPIADASIPDEAFELQWAEASEGLRARVRDGFGVLVHCKGGLGRAGTIGARLMIELGCDPDAAVTAVRKARPGAIETPAQLRYVMSRRAVPEAMPDTSMTAMKDRAVGAMMGLAVGDAIGTTLEFAARPSSPRLSDMVGGGPFRLKPGQWTDDTSLSLALADSLSIGDDLDEADLMGRFVRWHEEGEYSCTGTCFDIGITTRQALSGWKKTGDPVAGPTAPNTAGNGSLMRVAPVAVRYWRNRHLLRDVAARQSRTTHGAAEAVDACVVFAEVLADAIEGYPRVEVLRDRVGPYTGFIDAILAGSWRGKHRDQIQSSGYVVHSLEASLWSVGRSGTFREAVLLAANLGEDADTTAAVAGQLAGALHGVSAIPASWRENVAWADRITGAANNLFDAGVRS
jgi:ADP-ribosyl-[dinitrogen reductase] hydrolase